MVNALHTPAHLCQCASQPMPHVCACVALWHMCVHVWHCGTCVCMCGTVANADLSMQAVHLHGIWPLCQTLKEANTQWWKPTSTRTHASRRISHTHAQSAHVRKHILTHTHTSTHTCTHTRHMRRHARAQHAQMLRTRVIAHMYNMHTHSCQMRVCVCVPTGEGPVHRGRARRQPSHGGVARCPRSRALGHCHAPHWPGHPPLTALSALSALSQRLLLARWNACGACVGMRRAPCTLPQQP